MGTNTDGEQDESQGWGTLAGEGIEQKVKRTHRRGQQCSDY